MFDEVFQRLFDSYGPQHWWPGESKLEVIVGAVLTQNTSWQNVEQALVRLKEANRLTFRSLCDLPQEELAQLIRPAGYYRRKAQRLQNLLHFIDHRFGTVESMFQSESSALREALLRVSGIGPETADSILLYAGEYPTFVVDAYTARIAKRHGWVTADAGYAELQSYFASRLDPDVQKFNEFHALIVRVGKLHCKTKPQCEGCPLEPFLPPSGPLDITRPGR